MVGSRSSRTWLRERYVGKSVCAVIGTIPGQPAVNGPRHLKLSYNYDWSHMWRVRNSFIPYRTLIPLVLTSLSLEFWHHCRFWLCFPCHLPRHHRVQIQTRREAVCRRIQAQNKQLQNSVPQPDDVETAAPTAANSVNDLRADEAKAERLWQVPRR